MKKMYFKKNVSTVSAVKACMTDAVLVGEETQKYESSYL